MNLSTTGLVVLVVVIAAALMAMVVVIARANRLNSAAHSDPTLVERSASRSPGMNPGVADDQARKSGDDPDATVLPGGHVVRDTND